MGDATDWLDGEAKEPEWPDQRQPMHRCPGCDKDRPVPSFGYHDRTIGGIYAPQVLCEECRQVRPLTTPFDEKGKL